MQNRTAAMREETVQRERTLVQNVSNRLAALETGFHKVSAEFELARFGEAGSGEKVEE